MKGANKMAVPTAPKTIAQLITAVDAAGSNLATYSAVYNGSDHAFHASHFSVCGPSFGRPAAATRAARIGRCPAPAGSRTRPEQAAIRGTAAFYLRHLKWGIGLITTWFPRFGMKKNKSMPNPSA
jgi:hypothetical protein